MDWLEKELQEKTEQMLQLRKEKVSQNFILFMYQGASLFKISYSFCKFVTNDTRSGNGDVYVLFILCVLQCLANIFSDEIRNVLKSQFCG